PAEGRGEGAGALPVGRRGADESVAGAAGAGLGSRRGADGVPAAPAGAGCGSRGDGAPSAAGQGVEGVAALVRDVRELEDVEAQVAARVAESRSRRAFDPEDAEAQGAGA
ncbi:hypothetical protein, partial [Enterorhabdus sp. P55]|uniref:hypothetical protein n=1 Tax=Enterorhabdus sp. P55 TaxID=2304571 RepID=UPI001429BDFE